MRVPLVPVVILMLLVAASLSLGGLEGVGVLALGGAFLVAFSLVLFRRATTDLAGVRNRRAVDDANFLSTLVLTGIAVRVAVAVALSVTGFNAKVAPDENTFHENALWFSAWMRGDVLQPFSFKWGGSTQVGYFALTGALYATLGEYPFVPVLLNCVVGGLCAYPAYRLAARVSGRSAGRGAALLVTFFPSVLLWSTLFIRDALVLFFLLWSAFHAQSLLERFRFRTLLLLVVCLACLGSLRSYLLLLVAAAAVASFLVAGVRRPVRALAAAIACTAGAVVLMKVAGIGVDYLSDASLQGLAQRRGFNSLVGEGAIALDGYDLSTPTGALAYLPVGVAYFLFSPFPWQFPGRFAAIPEMLVWYACFPLVATGAVFALRRRRNQALVPLFAGLLITLLYSLVEGNIGIIFRHRAQAIVLLLPFAAIAWARRKRGERVRQRRFAADAQGRAAPARRAVAVTV